MGRKHDGVNAPRNQVLNVGDLLVGVFSSVQDDEILDQLRMLARVVFDLVNHLDAERIGDRVVRYPDHEWRLLLRRMTGRRAKGHRHECRPGSESDDPPARNFCVLTVDCHGVPSLSLRRRFRCLGLASMGGRGFRAGRQRRFLYRHHARETRLARHSPPLKNSAHDHDDRKKDRSERYGHTKLNEERRQHSENRHPDQGPENTAFAA